MELRLDQAEGSVFSLIDYIDLVGLRIAEYEEIMSEQFHLDAGILGEHRLDPELLGTDDPDLAVFFGVFLGLEKFLFKITWRGCSGGMTARCPSKMAYLTFQLTMNTS